MLLQRPPEQDWTKLVLLLLFIGLPLLGRLLRWIVQRANARGAQPPRPGRPAARRTEQRRVEREGEEVWRRLLEGIGEEPPPRQAPVPLPAPVSLETAGDLVEEPVALDILGSSPRPRESALEEVSLESPSAPAPLAALAEIAPASESPVSGRLAGLFSTSRDIRRAVLAAEVLGAPRGLRPL